MTFPLDLKLRRSILLGSSSLHLRYSFSYTQGGADRSLILAYQPDLPTLLRLGSRTNAIFDHLYRSWATTYFLAVTGRHLYHPLPCFNNDIKVRFVFASRLYLLGLYLFMAGINIITSTPQRFSYGWHDRHVFFISLSRCVYAIGLLWRSPVRGAASTWQ